MRHAPLAFISLVVLALVPASSIAQDWSQPWADPQDRPPRVDISASAGFLMPTRWTDLVLLGSISPAPGILEQVFTRGVGEQHDLGRHRDLALRHPGGDRIPRLRAFANGLAVRIRRHRRDHVQLETDD